MLTAPDERPDGGARTCALASGVCGVGRGRSRSSPAAAQVRELRQARGEGQDLEETVDRLLKRIEELGRAGKRQAGPFSDFRPGRLGFFFGSLGSENGRQSHRPWPEKVDEVVDVALPPECPDCGSEVEEVRVAEQFQTDLPPVKPITRRFDVHLGRCTCCDRRIQPRHPLQTSDALGAAAVQLGPNVLAFATALNKVYGPSWAKVAHLIEKGFGLKASPAAYCRAATRVGEKLDPTYESLKQRVAASPIVYPDETGWRVGGHRRWLWVFVAGPVTLYRIAASRGGEVAEEVFGAEYAGVIGRDGWAAYRRFEAARHQSCLGHLMRRAREILLVAKQGAAKFATAVLRTLRAALDLRDRRERLTSHGFLSLKGKIEAELDWLLSWRPAYALNARFVKHLRAERPHPAHLPRRAGARRHELAGRDRDPSCGPRAEAVRLQPHRARGAGAGADHDRGAHGPKPAPRRLRPPAPGRPCSGADRSRPPAGAGDLIAFLYRAQRRRLTCDALSGRFTPSRRRWAR